MPRKVYPYGICPSIHSAHSFLSCCVTEPERPTNALDYVKKYLGAPPSVDIDGLRKENEDLKKQLEKLKKTQNSSTNKS